MNKLEYSDLVKRKMKKLKKWLTEHYDLNTAKSILSEMMSDADRLKEYEESGTSIAEAYGIETDYWYLLTHQHYLGFPLRYPKTTSVPYYDKTSKTIKYDTKVTQYTEKNSISNLIKYMDNYKSYSFHKK